MTINLSSRGCELIIGSQNWTKWISFDQGLIVGYPEYEVGKGLMPVTGTITLTISRYDATVPSSPNPRLNPTQWKRGQLVTVRVANSSGALTYLPCSGQNLYLLRTPQKPKRTMEGLLVLSLDVGCRLALENFPPEPNQDISGITAGTALNRSVIIGNILNHIGVSHSISSMPYPIPYPLPKQTGNFIGFAGAIADSAGYYLRCNVSGTVISEPITATYSGGIVASYVIGNDEKLWDSIGDIAEQPVEKLIVTGTVKTITPVDTSPSEIVDIQPAGVLFKGTPLGNQNPTALFIAKKTINTSQLTTVSYTTIEEIQEPAGVILKGTAFGDQNPTILIISKKTTTSWSNTGSQKWTKTTQIEQPAGILFKGTPLGNGAPTALFVAENLTDDKDTSGPPTNFGNASTNTTEETQLKAEVFAQQLANDPYRPRQRTIDLPYTVEQAQLVDYGARFNRILSGRANGQQFAGVITNTALSSSFKPFAEVSVADTDGITYYLKLDCIKWGLNGTEAWLVFNGIETAVGY